MIETYQPSGRFNPAVLILAPFLATAGIAAAWLYQWLIALNPIYIFNVLLTAGFGLVLGMGTFAIVNIGKCRNVLLGVLISLAASTISVGTGHYFAYLLLRGKIAAMIQPGHQQHFEAGWHFGKYLDLRFEKGWKLRHGAIRGAFVHLIWVIEGGAVVGIAAALARKAARRPYSEACDAWAVDVLETLSIPAPSPDAVGKIKSSTSVEDLLESPPAGGGPENTSLTYTLSGCPEDKDQAFLSIALKTVVINQKGKAETKKSPLLSAIILNARKIERFRAFVEKVKAAPPAPGSAPPLSS